MKIAIVHDWLISIGGAEKVLKEILNVYPEADLYCLLDYFKEPERKLILNGKKAKTSYLQQIPGAKKYYRYMVPFLFRAIEKFDLKDYNLVISSSHAVAKGVVTGKDQVHICYCHTPIRYVWNMKKTYLQQIPGKARKIAGNQLNRLQKWDLVTASNVDHYIANSRFVADRILKNYGKQSKVIHPPVDIDFYHLPEAGDVPPRPKPYYLIVSRLVHYKRVDLIVEAFNRMPDKNLVVVGEGPQLQDLEKKALENISFTGFLKSEEVRQYMQHADAMVLTAIEDFGITSLESQACGTPVVAFNFGGYKESVVHEETGVLFNSQTVQSIINGVEAFTIKKDQFDPIQIRSHALLFSTERFREYTSEFIRSKIEPSEAFV